MRHRRPRRPIARGIVLPVLAVSVLALAGCAADRAGDDPYNSGRYGRPSLASTRPATVAGRAPRSYRLPTTNLSPGYDYDGGDYDGGEPRVGHLYVEIGPYNPGDPVALDYDSANRTLYEHHEAEYGYPYTDGFYGAPTRPRFYGAYRDWYYGPRYRHKSPWYRHHLYRHPDRFDRRFHRIPQPYRHRDHHDVRRHGHVDLRDRGQRYDRDRKPARAPETHRFQRMDRAPQPNRAAPRGQERAQPSRSKFRLSRDEEDNRHSGGDGARSNRTQRLPR